MDPEDEVALVFFHFALRELYEKHFMNGKADDLDRCLEFIRSMVIEIAEQPTEPPVIH